MLKLTMAVALALFSIAASAQMDQEEHHRQKLWIALQTRVLTETEMTKALNYGPDLNIFSGETYNVADKTRERLAAFEMQLLLRKMEALKPCTTGITIPSKPAMGRPY